MLSPLQVRDVVVEEIAIVRGEPLPRGSRAPRQLQYNIAVDFDVRKRSRKGAPPLFDVQMSISLSLAEPLRGAPVQKVVGRLRGLFAFHPGAPKELINKLVPANCLAVLYGIARGFVLQDTGACPGGGFLLPTLDMYAIVEQKKAKGSVTAALQAATSTPRTRTAARKPPSRSQPDTA
jgi:preprotein translocase subunit SecB